MKKQVATWIVAGALVVGVGAAFAVDGPSDPTTSGDPTSTTVADTSTTVADTSTTVADTSPTVADTSTTVADTSGTVESQVSDPATAPGNSWAAQNHDCDAAWGNHGAWVSANAKARKTQTTVPCDPTAQNQASTNTSDSTTSTTVAGDTTSTTVAGDSTPTTVAGAATATATTGHGRGHGKKG